MPRLPAVLVFLLSMAQAPARRPSTLPSTSRDTITPTSTQAQDSTARTIALLSALLEAEREHNAALMDTVYWSLGVTATIALALLGFGWFVNFRVYERDKEALTKAIENELKTQGASLAADLQSRYAALNERATTEAKALETRLAGELEGAVATKVSEVTIRLKAHSARLSELTMNLSLFQADYQLDKAYHGNAFSNLLKAASIAESLSRPFVVQQVADTLEKHVSKMNGIFATDLRELETFVEKAKDLPDNQRQRLQALFRSVPKL